MLTTKKTTKSLLDDAHAVALAARLKPLKDYLTKMVYEATPGLIQKKHSAAPKDPKVLELMKVFKSGSWGSGQTRESVKKVAEILVGHKIDIDPLSLKAFTLVVPIKNTNGHCYALGNVCMLIRDDTDVAIEVRSGEVQRGDHLPMDSIETHPEIIRYATKAEADEFIGKLLASPKNIEDMKALMQVSGWPA